MIGYETKNIILSALVCLLPTTMWADELPDSIYKSLELEQVVVTGTRTPKLLANTPVLTKLITADDIMKTDATNLRDVLQQVIPGIEFSYAMNQQVHMNFSGFGGQSMLILVDGDALLVRRWTMSTSLVLVWIMLTISRL